LGVLPIGKSMQFVELQRNFAPIRKDNEPTLDVGRIWGRKFGGWLGWSELREHRRVVLLAEASSGKSAEFRNQTHSLRGTRQAAFFVTIEELADHGFEAALEPTAAHTFEQWRGGTGDAWFFLDSLDEARLNRKSFEMALKRFARALGPSIERARILISCRVSDWKGNDDRGFIERLLPAWERPKEPQSGANALLDPIFKQRQTSRTRPSTEPERKPNELLVVQLLPLDLDQCRTLAVHLGVRNADEFIIGIRQNGLEAFAERPGDVIDLADYWKTYGLFGSFADMVEHGINRKINERDSYRPDNDAVTMQQAREGAERLAAALTLAKSFTVRAPGHDFDPTLAAGALDPTAILDDWTEAQRNALLRRAVFAPATYGRIRFHHRSTQEYLMARWLDRLLHGRGSREAIWNVLFADRYGVRTVVPSLRPAAAWLALRHSDFQDEIISREPLTLIRHGDPGSLSIEARTRLLAVYASKQSQAEISDDSIDNRAVWMFADARLGDAIRAAWIRNPSPDFRFELLRFIREGAIAACVDLAREVALDPRAEDLHRVVALQALAACKDKPGLSAATQNLVNNAARLGPRVSVEAARALYPNYLGLPQLFTLIEQAPPQARYSAEGFGYAISALFEATPKPERDEFIARLSSLCLSEPFVQRYQRVSKRYLELARHVEPIARRELQALGDREPSEHLIHLLMVVERAERDYDHDDEGPSLRELVHSKPKVQRALAWSDVAEQRAREGSDAAPTYFWQVTTLDSPPWQFSESDLPWLFQDLAGRSAAPDQRIALNAILAILTRSNRLDAELPRLRALAQHCAHLQQELESYLAPQSPPSAAMRNHELKMAEHQRIRAAQQKRDRESWTRFEQELRQDPNQLRDPEKVTSWRAGAYRLWHLTRWLMHRTGANDEAAPAQWRLLEEGFGREVAEAYRDGLKIHWRATKPERPKRRKGGAITIKYPNILAFAAVGVEAGENPDWTSGLTDEEAKRAALHGCLTEQGYPEWIESLVESHPRVALPVIRRAIRQEYLSGAAGVSAFLYRYGRGMLSTHPAIQKILFALIVSKEPRELNKFDCMVGMAERIELNVKQRNKLFQISEQRLNSHLAARRIAEARWSLALLLLLDLHRGLAYLESWLSDVPPTEVKKHAEQTFAFLFDPHDPTIPSALRSASVADLERLLRLVYTHIRPEADAYREGSYTPNTRDHAENARNSILTTLLERPGADAYRAFRRVADDPAVALRAARFRELARGMAERDAELPAWTPKEVVNFERERTAPVKTGSDLLRLVEAILKDIQFQFTKGDASSRRVVQRAEDEDEVQNWLVEQLNLRARDRFRAFREAEVAQGDKPDVIVASTSASCEVAIEVKHGKRWTVRQLDAALRNQLAEDYLKPEARRHGILVITHHRTRQWRDIETDELMTFPRLIGRLSATAAALTHNAVGAIEVKCMGIDATDPSPEPPHNRSGDFGM
jgi:hypothetical protein